MEKRRCGKSEIELSVLGLGCMSFGGGSYWGSQNQEDVNEVVQAALDYGINYFDTAEMYNDGRSEESLGQALQGFREKAVIGTKVNLENTPPEVLRAHCEMSLRRLRTDWIDLYMIHWPIPIQLVEGAFNTLEALIKEGKIRAIGVSNFGFHQLKEAQLTGVEVVSDQLCYSLLARAIESEILPYCLQEEVGVIGYMPLMQGLLTGRYRCPEEMRPSLTRTRHFSSSRAGTRHGEAGAEQETFATIEAIKEFATSEGIPMESLALAWVIARPGITCALVGSRNLRQLLVNIKGASLSLSSDVLNRLDELTDGLFKKLGTNLDYWNSNENSRIR